MTVYFKLVFALLLTEITALTVLISPLPLAVRKRLAYVASSTGPVISSVAYSIKIALIAVTIFFVDAVHRLRLITAEGEKSKSDNAAQMHDIATQTSFTAKKVYAQRNMYLTGFCLFLSFVLVRVFNMVVQLADAEEVALRLQGNATKQAKANAELASSDQNLVSSKKELNQKAALDKLSEKAQ